MYGGYDANYGAFLPQAMAGNDFGAATAPMIFDNTVVPEGGAPIGTPGNLGMNPDGTPVTPLQPTWKDALMKGLTNYGILSEVAKMGMGMMAPNNIMKPIAAGAANMFNIVQYNDAMKKAGLSIPGTMAGTGTLGTTGSLSEPGAATGGSSSLTGSPSTGLSGADVIGLPLPAVKGIYDTAFARDDAMHKRGIDETKLLLDAINTGSTIGYREKLGKQADVTADWHQAQIDKMKRLEGDEAALKEYWTTIAANPDMKGTTMAKWAPTLAKLPASLSARFGEDLLKNEMNPQKSTVLELAADEIKKTGHVSNGTMEVLKMIHPSASKDPTLIASLQLDARNRVMGRTLAELNAITAANPGENAKIQQLLRDMQVNPAGASANYPTVYSMALKYPELVKKMRTWEAAYNNALSQGMHPSMVEPMIDSGKFLPGTTPGTTPVPGPGTIPESALPPDAKAAMDFYTTNQPQILKSLQGKPSKVYPITKNGVTYYVRWNAKTGEANLEFNPNIAAAKSH